MEQVFAYCEAPIIRRKLQSEQESVVDEYCFFEFHCLGFKNEKLNETVESMVLERFHLQLLLVKQGPFL